ncbi:MAG: hypothetical protein II914_05160 [Clostridia bacterium]|nr:hypothetical protein [Clostridia bacterium]MBQ6426689.1 hypothetical protein [Clostridia bacterium]MBR0445395.1 hypothetical protein [Clostridia bacterium]
MSVSFNVKEHLQVKKETTHEPSAPLIIMQGQLLSLAGLMLIDEAEIQDLKMTADGVAYNFRGSHPDHEFSKLLSVMLKARDVEISVHYSYFSRLSSSMYDTVGPFPLMEYMKDPDETEKEFPSCVFYSAWYSADGDCPGTLAAYGTRNGKTYSGTVDLKQVSAIPGGAWDELCMPMLVTANASFDVASDPDLGEVLRGLAGMGSGTELYHDEDLELYLNNLDISSDEKVARFTEHTHRLVSIDPEEVEVRICGAFVDLSGDDARMLTIDYNENGFDYRIAEVA